MFIIFLAGFPLWETKTESPKIALENLRAMQAMNKGPLSLREGDEEDFIDQEVEMALIEGKKFMPIKEERRFYENISTGVEESNINE